MMTTLSNNCSYPSSIASSRHQLFTWKIIFSFETIFVLYLFAGRYKGDPRFSWIPFDITLLFFILSVTSGIILLGRRRIPIRKDVSGLILAGTTFFCYCIASLLWSPGEVYAIQKAVYTGLLTFWPFLACALIIGQDRVRMIRFFVILCFFSLWLALEAYFSYLSTNGVGSIYALGGNYLGLGRTIGLGALLLLAFALFSRWPKGIRGVSLGLFLVLCYLMLLMGGRGPALAVVAGALAPVFTAFSFKDRISIKKYFFVIFFLFLAGLIYLVHLLNLGELPATIRRMMLLGQEGMGVSAGERMVFYHNAFELWLKAPIFGHGIGSWPIINGEPDARSYPHNIILEVLVEFGVSGFGLFLYFLRKALRQFRGMAGIRICPFRQTIFMLLVNAFLNAMVSGDIPDNRILFGILGLTAFSTVRDYRHA